MLEAAHLWLVCRDGVVQFSCSSVQLRSHCQRFATGPAWFSSVLARSVNTVLHTNTLYTFSERCLLYSVKSMSGTITPNFGLKVKVFFLLRTKCTSSTDFYRTRKLTLNYRDATKQAYLISIVKIQYFIAVLNGRYICRWFSWYLYR